MNSFVLEISYLRSCQPTSEARSHTQSIQSLNCIYPILRRPPLSTIELHLPNLTSASVVYTFSIHTSSTKILDRTCPSQRELFGSIFSAWLYVMSNSDRPIIIPSFGVPQAWLSNPKKLALLAIELALLLLGFDNMMDDFICFTDPVIWQVQNIWREGETGLRRSLPMGTSNTDPASL